MKEKRKTFKDILSNAISSSLIENLLLTGYQGIKNKVESLQLH